MHADTLHRRAPIEPTRCVVSLFGELVISDEALVLVLTPAALAAIAAAVYAWRRSRRS